MGRTVFPRTVKPGAAPGRLRRVCAGGLRMTGAGELSGADAPTMLARATEAVQKATEVRTTSRSIADAVEAGKAAIGHERANR